MPCFQERPVVAAGAHAIARAPFAVGLPTTIPGAVTEADFARQEGRMLVRVHSDGQIRGVRRYFPGWTREKLPVAEAVKQVPDGVLDARSEAPIR